MDNQTLFQFFHWYSYAQQGWWNYCTEEAARLSSLGVSHVYLPPAYKSAYGGTEPGYAVYDLFDLGEFDQKGSVPTKYGTKAEYLRCIKALHRKKMMVIADIVFNHKQGADEVEKVKVKMVNPENRNELISEEKEIEAHTKFTFPGRNRKYSEYIWDHNSFSGVDGDYGKTIYTILNQYGEKWEELAENELGNFDFLMGADLEFRNPNVRTELKWWGKWYFETTGIDGFRLDAVKHISPDFITDWLDYMRHTFQKDFFCVSEYWRQDPDVLLHYLQVVGDRTQLFDVPLHYNFFKASKEGKDFDMRTIFDNTLTQHRPDKSVTFVDNHDTQPLQALESTVDFWFKPLAYALILLRAQAIPCIFYPALYGAKYSDKKGEEEINIELNVVPGLDKMMIARKYISYGQQRDYFDHGNTIGWTREGIGEKRLSGCAVLMTNGSEGHKAMEVGKRHAHQVFIDLLGNRQEKITINKDGWGEFTVNAGSVSVWINEKAAKFLDKL